MCLPHVGGSSCPAHHYTTKTDFTSRDEAAEQLCECLQVNWLCNERATFRVVSFVTHQSTPA